MTHEHEHGSAGVPEKPPHGPQEVDTPEARPALDEASASLAEALHTSFRVLTFLIILLLGLFFVRGFFTVEPDTRAIILRFGQASLDSVKGQGLHYAYPYPIESYEVIPVSLKKLEVNTFWPEVSEGERQQAVEKNAPVPPPVPGAESASMLTGDGNVLEARWDITYRINRGDTQDDKLALINYYKNIFQSSEELRKRVTIRDEQGKEKEVLVKGNEELLIRNAVQSAVVRQIGRSKVSDIYPQRMISIEGHLVPLNTVVRDDVEKVVKAQNVGIVIEQVNLIDIRPPKDVKASFDEVLAAQQDADKDKKKAEQERQSLLYSAAGDVGVKLGDEIEKWWAAKSSGDAEALQKSDAKMRELFSQAKSGGKVQTTIAEAKAYRTTVEQSAKGDAAQVTSLANMLANSPREVKIFLDHARIDALQEVISNCYEVYVFNPLADGKTRAELDLWLSRRAELNREMKQAGETR